MKLNHLRPMALSLIAVLATAPAALALDANDFGSKLLAAYSSSMSGSDKLTLGQGTVNGNDITFDGASLTTTASATPMTVNTKLTFSNVVEGADGSYTADALSVPDVDYTADGNEVTVKNIVLKHVYVGATASATDSSRLFGEIDVGPITVTSNGTPIVTLDAVSIANTFKPSQTDAQVTELDSAGSTTGLKIDLSQVKDPSSTATIAALGLQTLTGKVAEGLTWSLPDGHMTASEMSVAFDNVGKLNIGFELTGYTPEFVKTLSSATSSMGAASDANSGAQTAALLQAAQKVFVNGVTIRFDDASITGKLLDYFAKQSGASRADFITGIVASMAQMSGAAAPPAVTKLLQAALQAYLTDPHSLEIKIAPPAPLGVLDFAAAAMQPDAFVKQVGLQVLVNDKQITADATGDTGAAPAPAAGSDDNSSSDDSSDSTNSDSN